MSQILPPILPIGGPLPTAPTLTSRRHDRPLTTLYKPAPRHEPRWLCSVRRVDANGRVIEKTLLPALGWCPGIRLGYRIEGKMIVVGSFRDSELWITAAGDLRLPARFRRKTALHTSDQPYAIPHHVGSDRGAAAVGEAARDHVSLAAAHHVELSRTFSYAVARASPDNVARVPALPTHTSNLTCTKSPPHWRSYR